jgi:hypothetical protein
MSDTPETDALYKRLLAENPGNFIHLEEFLELACCLERDEALTAIHNYKCEVEAWELLAQARHERDEARAVAYDLAVIASHCLGSHDSALLTETSERIADTLKRWKELKK